MKDSLHLPRAKSTVPALAVLLCLVALNGCRKAKSPEDKSLDASTFEPPKVMNGRDIEFPEKMAPVSIFKTTQAKPTTNDEARFTARVTWTTTVAPAERSRSTLTSRLLNLLGFVLSGMNT